MSLHDTKPVHQSKIPLSRATTKTDQGFLPGSILRNRALHPRLSPGSKTSLKPTVLGYPKKPPRLSVLWIPFNLQQNPLPRMKSKRQSQPNPQPRMEYHPGYLGSLKSPRNKTSKHRPRKSRRQMSRFPRKRRMKQPIGCKGSLNLKRRQMNHL